MSAKKKFYPNLKEAAAACKALRIHTASQYKARRKEDPRLPSAPNILYAWEWQGYPSFLDKPLERYTTYAEAKEAVKTIGAYTLEQYKRLHNKDSLLPATPESVYKSHWVSWGEFLPSNPELRFYESLAEAAEAVRALGITSTDAYKLRYKEDPLLPSTPNKFYADSWQGFSSLFDGVVGRYPTYSEAKEAVKVIGARSMSHYKRICGEDPKLPVSPEVYYGDAWKSWTDYLPYAPNSKFYSSLLEATDAVKRLGIQSQDEYRDRYKEDVRLPSNPNAVYSEEWKGFPKFFNRSVERYESYAEAKNAVKTLGIFTAAQYRVKHVDDVKLPGWPEDYYGNTWSGWRDFLPVAPYTKYYLSLAEATAAAKSLGIRTQREYKQRYKEDSRLPANPQVVYAPEWSGFKDFLVRSRVKFYGTYSLAKKAVELLGGHSEDQYKIICQADSNLPPDPESFYSLEWRGWDDFLSQLPMDRRGKYATLAEASSATKRLSITTQRDYQSRYGDDKKLPGSPDKFYSAEWSGWGDFTGFVYRDKQENFYSSYAQASAAAKALGAKSRRDYWNKATADDRLPLYPDKTYSGEWISWDSYLGNFSNAKKYETYEEARAAARALDFGSNTNYTKTRKSLDPRLPGSPVNFYKENWQSWPDYLGSRRGKVFYSLEEAAKRTAELGIYTTGEYVSRYREDPLLPADPAIVYRKEWTGFGNFLTKLSVPLYETLDMAKEAVQRLAITSVYEYRARHHEDPRLPSNPNTRFAEEWIGYPDLFGDTVLKYETVGEASEAAQRLGFSTKEQYLIGYKADPRLPSSPHQMYAKNWKLWGWDAYLGVEKYNLKEAGTAARMLGITNATEYQRLRANDLRLPANPLAVYRTEWKGWFDFLLPEECVSLQDVKFVIKVLQIKNSQFYREEYKNFPCLPAHPDRVFKNEWVDWYDLCEMPVPYSYEEACVIVRKFNVKGQQNYKAFVVSHNDEKLPRHPEQTYKDEWISWFEFLGKPVPFKTKYIRAPYLAWKKAIDNFMKVARGGEAKEAQLCRFVRGYIQHHELGHSPEIFLTATKVDTRLFEAFVYNLENKANERAVISAVKEFCDHILKHKLTIEDEETGELGMVPGARNPFSMLVYEGEVSSGNLGESNKPALAYQYVSSMCEWIVPIGAKSFSDLEHLHAFDADWMDIDPSLVDANDPDCVIKQEYGRTKIWCPVSWMHTYAIASVPARGRQLAYNDSGEADYEVPEIVEDKIVWLKNPSALAGSTKNQGFVKKYPDGHFGMHFTSNKTSSKGSGYDVAWMPEQLALWMIRLRRWQANYNPISRPMPWKECTRTDLNETLRKAKGANCFLFRDFGDEECGHFSHRLKDRLAAALFYSQPKTLVLAECRGSPSALSTYKSIYTAHSMRVSLITAYVMEFGLPLEIVMKIAGHSAIVMTIYYVKLNSEGLRQKFAEGEKRALSNQVYAAIQMIEQNRIDEIRDKLITNNEEALQRYTGNSSPGSNLFRDYGFCPFAGTRCYDGGPLIGSTQVRQPVSAGYLGTQNCPHCRHFVSGPVFIGGLLSLANEISLQATFQFEHIADLEEKSAEATKRVDELDDEEYLALKAGEKFDMGERNAMEMKVRKLRSELESAAKKADLYLCDIQAVARLINQSQALINEQVAADPHSNLPQLIVQNGHELHIAMEETSRFNQLNEVCENAEIYESASADLALAPRSQMIDRMIAFNNMKPSMFALDRKQQLVIGNQLTNFLLSRVKSWTKLDAIMDGRMRLEDLSSHEHIALTDIQEILQGRKLALESGVE